MNKSNNVVPIILTVLYSMLWFSLLFLVVGFFMTKPVAFYNKIKGKRIHVTPKNNKSSSKYGYSDDPIEDEAMFIDDMDED